RPLWLQIQVPENTPAGTYSGEVSVTYQSNGQRVNHRLPYTVNVKDHVLPNPEDWEFHLDLWQNPYSSARYYNVLAVPDRPLDLSQNPYSAARYYNVPALSDEHLALIRPHYERLANAGQKSITATLIYDPWNSQTYDVYDSMVKWVKKKDGSWSFDYTKFDKWVEFMHDLGIQK